MAIRKVRFSIDEFYHLYSRGIDKRLIFIDQEDYKRFIRLLYLCNGSMPIDYRNLKSLSLTDIEVGEKLIGIGAYCLMPNHFHILVKEIHEKGVEKFMSKILTAYSSYFNKKYERTGSLFGSRFKSEHLDKDAYLKYIYAYIHLNPAKLQDSNWREHNGNKNDLNAFLNVYPYSSYPDYLKKRMDEQSLVLNPEFFPEYFQNPEEFQNEIWEWLNFNQI